MVKSYLIDGKSISSNPQYQETALRAISRFGESRPTGICIVIYNTSVLISQCLQQSTVNTIEKDQGVKRPPHPFMALKRDLLLDFRHRPNAIFSNIASFAPKAAGGDDRLKRNIHHETLLSSMKVAMFVHQSVQCMTRTI